MDQYTDKKQFVDYLGVRAGFRCKSHAKNSVGAFRYNPWRKYKMKTRVKDRTEIPLTERFREGDCSDSLTVYGHAQNPIRLYKFSLTKIHEFILYETSIVRSHVKKFQPEF